jgi:transmembrane sensor
MSGAAKDVKAAASAWRERQDREDWNAEKQTAFDAWLAEDYSHKIAFLRVDAAWARTERLVALRGPLPEAAEPARAQIPLLAKLAAALIFTAAIGFGGARYFAQPQDRTYSTPVGGHEVVSFADGTRIELNTNTVLRTRMTTQERMVWLVRGEAFFKVRHDAAHPFTVMVGGRRVTDLGTEFRVLKDGKRTEVAVVQGKVRFEAPDAQAPMQTAVLTPGDVATATAGSMLLTKKSEQALTNELSWRRGVLVFRYTPLSEAVAEFNRYNQTRIVVADAGAAKLKIYGTFRATHIEDFTALAQMVLGLHVKTNGNEILITR